jgi:signal recognition particle receptor subunit beta
VQFNKRDLPDILSEEEIAERWQGAQWPLVFASALSGEGVSETFSQLLEPVYRHMDETYLLNIDHGLDAASFIKGMGV